MECDVYRCARQPELYLYLAADRDLASLPEALRRRTGALTRVLRVDLAARAALARADIDEVRRRVAADGWYLQMPPSALVHGHLDDGD
jgi:uncharacterized protein YcgL (UPF0745 family)